MSELHRPNGNLIRLELQPDFPNEDLTDNNASMLAYQLQSEAGLLAQSEQLQQHQRYVHLIADRALKFLGIKTDYAEEELFSFSHGFASFETISDVVRPPHVYDMHLARQRVEQLFVDTRDFFDIEIEEFNRAMDEGRDPQPPSRDRPAPELELANRHGILPEHFPNTYDVIVGIGEARHETTSQLQIRTAGAQLAYSLQSK